MDIQRVDSWFVKGFDGITGLVIHRSQSKLHSRLVKRLEDSIKALDKAILKSREVEPVLNADIQLFDLLLWISETFLLRIQSDSGLDSSNREQMTKYITTLKTALERFQEYEQRASSPKDLGEHHSQEVLSD